MIEVHLPVNSRVFVLVTGDMKPVTGVVAWRIEGEMVDGHGRRRYTATQFSLDDGRYVGADQCEWWGLA